jgi:hypothetical protein
MDQELYKAATENFSLPHDVVVLPSQGLFYKSKKKSVKLGYLTATDENYLLSNSPLIRDNMVMTLLRNKIYEHDLRPEELLEGDVEAILIFLRNTSFGPEYNLVLIDPKTGKPFNHIEYLDSLDFKKTSEKPNENGLFTTKLPKTQVVVELRPLTFYEIIEIDKACENYPPTMVAPRITMRLQKMITSVNGNTDGEEIGKLIQSLPIMDSKHIRNFIKNNQPGLDLIRTTISPSGERVTFSVSFGDEFFRPFF